MIRIKKWIASDWSCISRLYFPCYPLLKRKHLIDPQLCKKQEFCDFRAILSFFIKTFWKKFQKKNKKFLLLLLKTTDHSLLVAFFQSRYLLSYSSLKSKTTFFVYVENVPWYSFFHFTYTSCMCNMYGLTFISSK